MSVPRRVVDPRTRAPDSGVAHSSRRSRFDATVRQRANEFGVPLRFPPWVLVACVSSTVLALGLRLGGLVGAAVSCVALVASWVVLLRVLAHRVRRSQQERLPEVALRLSRALRAGRAIDHAFRDTVLTVGNSPPTLVRAAHQMGDGRAASDSLEDAARNASSAAETLLLSALNVGMTHGGRVADALDLVGAGLRDDVELGRRRKLLVGQSTLSAAVLVVMPLAFAIVASAVHGSVIFTGRVGGALLLAGLLLDVIGTFWMRSLLRRLR